MKKVYVLLLAMLSTGAFAQYPDFQKMRDVPPSSGKTEVPSETRTPKKVFPPVVNHNKACAGICTHAVESAIVTVSFFCTGAKIGGTSQNYVQYVPNITLRQLKPRTEYELYNDAGEKDDGFELYFDGAKSVVESSDSLVDCFVTAIE